MLSIQKMESFVRKFVSEFEEMLREFITFNEKSNLSYAITSIIIVTILTVFYYKKKQTSHNPFTKPPKTTMESIKHSTVHVNGINIHIAEAGPENAPTILFIHGFPELWYTWRHQMLYLSSLGYRTIAPDLRGYGDTDAPSDRASYTVFHIVGDLVGLIDEVCKGEESVFVVGHDWGAIMAWNLCMFRGDKVKALVNLSVAFSPRIPKRKVMEAVRSVYGDDYYICRIQEPGELEAEFAELGTETVLKEFFTYRNPGPLFLPKGKGFGHPPNTAIELPPWITEDEFRYYTEKFEKTGFTGGFNYYRNLDLNWELTAPWTGSQIKVPVKFIVGDQDLSYTTLGVKDYIEKGGFKKFVPNLEEVIIMEGVGHFIQEEKADDISKHIYDFFKKF